MSRWIFLILCFFLTGLFFCISCAGGQVTYPLRPGLVVVLVVDQFRADYLTRLSDRFQDANGKGGVGGFAYLMEQGAYYPQARHDVLQAMTGPGHATISTGSYPHRNGIPLNNWFDVRESKEVYCGEGGQREIGSDRKRSPENLLGQTLGDSIKMAGPDGRVVSISIKDRAAILMGGYSADAVVWFGTDTFQWTSSRFYFPDSQLPPWLFPLNDEISKRKGEQVKIGGQSFAIGEKDVLRTPFGAEITLKAAKAAIDHYKLGNGPGTDLLMVSFSSHDTAGHYYGPNSRELEEMTLAEDRAIAELMDHLEKRVKGRLADILVVLTGDHGIAPLPEYMEKRRVPSRQMNMEEIRENLENHLVEKIGPPPVGSKWVEHVEDFNFFFNASALDSGPISRKRVEQAAKELLLSDRQFFFVFTRSEVLEGRLPEGQLKRQISHSYFPGRSGDVVAVPRPFIMNDEYPTTHITGYAYDATVPILFSGPGIRNGLYATPAESVDIAPTIAFLLGIVPPAMAEGRVLDEILDTGNMTVR